MKKALLLCASHNDLGLIRSLRKLGYYILVTGNTPNLLGQKYCDEYIQADYSNAELVLSIAKENQINAVCQCCNDFGVYTASYVAEKLGLPGYDSYETALLLHNKDKFKELAKRLDLISPLSSAFETPEDAVSYLGSVNFPIIIKPTDASAGNGIRKAEYYQDAVEAIDFAFSKSRSKRIVIESFIKGSQHGFCTFLVNQKVVACCTNNEFSFVNPYRVEIDTYPADNCEIVSESLISQVEKVASTLRLKDGIFHLQYIYDGKQAYIIEVMRRVLGNMYHVPGNMLTGMDWEYWETRAKCGLSCDSIPRNSPQEGYFAYKAIVSDVNGVIKSFSVPEKYKKYVCNTHYLHEQGYKIENHQSDPAGFLFFMFPSADLMKSVLIDGYSNDVIEVK